MKKFFERNHLLMALLLSVVYVLFCSALNAQAAIVWSGDVIPTDPATWTASTNGYIGKTTTGAVTVDGGSGLLSDVYLGYASGSTGTATVTGIGSKWTSTVFTIGVDGTGVLNIEAGGQVKFVSCSISTGIGHGKVRITGPNSILTSNAGQFYVGSQSSGTLIIEAGGQVNNFDGYVCHGSSVTVTGIGSRWVNGNLSRGGLRIDNSGSSSLTVSDGGEVTTNDFFAPLSSLFGNGIITTKGAVLDGDFTFDAAHGPQPTLAFGTGGTLKLDATQNNVLGAGYQGNGTMKIVEGVAMSSQDGYLGYDLGSAGMAMVTGSDSKWTTSSSLYVGFSGNGTLKIEAGGQVENYFISHLGFNSGSVGTATVSGTGSKWINHGYLYVGYSSTGRLNIIGGGEVTASGIPINNRSLLTIDVGTGSSLIIANGSGTITNNGTVRILAGAKATANATYSPISAGTWSGSGVYQPVGGIWNATTHQFTVSGVQPGDSGVPVTIDRLSTQRMLIGNGPADWVLGASLAATNVSSSLTLTATAIGDGPRVALTGLLSAGDSLLGGWNLSSSNGYTAGDPLYLSFGNGTDIGTSSRYMQVWSYDGTTWSKFDAPDLTSNGSYACFTATALGCYAVTVPEPGTAVLLVFALAGLATIARRKR